MNTQTAKTTIFRIVACALFVLLIWGALDTIPDPPAVMQHQQHNLVTGAHKNSVSLAKVVPVFLSILAPAVRFQRSQVSDLRVERTIDNLDFLSQASDPSPPLFS
ncbi:MAG TPA: hypothetical protein VIY69_03790 [Candidatus Acidoferrales bacterium]